jgi:hypothetical protein
MSNADPKLYVEMMQKRIQRKAMKARWYDSLIVYGGMAIVYGLLLYSWFWLLGEVFSTDFAFVQMTDGSYYYVGVL